MKNKKHVMVDIETLGSTPGCAVLSIGAVEFFPDINLLGEEFYAAIDLQSCIDRGLKIEGATFYWWLEQEKKAQEALCFQLYQLHTSLYLFSDYFQKCSPDLIWAHGPSFDLAVLSSAFHSTAQKKPWNFRDERDTRTVLDLAGMKMPKIEGAHHALADAKSQAITIMEAIRKLQP